MLTRDQFVEMKVITYFDMAFAGTTLAVIGFGLLFAGRPRLLLVDGVDVEAPLEDTLILISNDDQPGVIGEVGTILGRHAIGQTLALRVLRQSKLLELRATVSGQPEDRAPRG